MSVVPRSPHYKWWNGGDIPTDVLGACARLFSAHYGRWSERGVAPGKPIRLTAEGLRDYLPAQDSLAVTAWSGDGAESELIGYAFAVRLKDRKHRIITWVTQLVVHSRHQNRGVAKTMLNSIWGFSDHYAWGIASANPYAIRALEKATKRRCSPRMAAQSVGPVLAAAGRRIPYLRERRRDCFAERSMIVAGFHQDHSLIPVRLARVAASTDGKKSWRLGQIGPGEEWLGVTFNRQKPIKWTGREFSEFMAAAAQIVREAYDRMALSRPDKNHAWARHAEAEADFLVCESGLEPGASVLDFGCGVGRHAWALARRGYRMTGVDFSQQAITAARTGNDDCPFAPEFVQGDCRVVDLGRQFDMGYCLYDVVGSFPDDDDDNMRILENLSRHVRTGGVIALSVMSYPYTASKAKHQADIIADSRPLEELKAGRIMQETGDVFDPDHFVLDTRKRVVYRKEQFDIGAPLPQEIIVRDRRYDIDEITSMCRKVGIDVIRAGHVAAGRFSEMSEPGGRLRKEILVIGRKNSII
jgi:2-polyprenyl-3-methyl-5-hydroxy-6-metoxy-1,4-benzoquinol methylase/GNAT superfamily N-acetyltransferase